MKRGWIAGLLLLVAGNAAAIPVSYQGFFGSDIDIGVYHNEGGPITATYNLVTLGFLPGFDSSLGTLNSVSLSFASEIAHGMNARANDDRLTCGFFLFFCHTWDVETSVDVFNTVRYTAFLANAPGVSMSRSFEEHEACSAYSDDLQEISCFSNSSPAVHDGFAGFFDLSGSSLADFTDISQLILGFQFQSILSGTCQDDLGDSCSVQRGGVFNGLYQVTYDYTPRGSNPTDPTDPTDPNPDPTEVPAPGPVLMWATALLGMALVRPRKRKS